MIGNLNDDIVTKLRKNDTPVTARELAQEFSVSERTIRRRIVLINESILKDIGHIQSYPSKGYKLKIEDHGAFNEYYDYLVSDTGMGNALNRRSAIFDALVVYNCIDKWTLMDTYFISETTLHHDIKEINKISAEVGVNIKYESNNGFYIQGGEYQVRNTALRLIGTSGATRIRKRISVINRTPIIEAIQSAFLEEKVVINIHVMDAVANYVLMASKHILLDRHVDFPDYFDQVYVEENLRRLAKTIFDSVSTINGCFFDEDEVKYFSFFLKANLPIESPVAVNEFDVFAKRAKKWTQTALEVLSKVNKQRITQAVENELFRFFYAYSIRVELNIQRRVKTQENIKNTYPIAYIISETIFKNLKEISQSTISPEEIAYLSLIIHFHFTEVDYSRKTILAILPTDESVAKIFRMEFDRLFRCLIDYRTFNEVISLSDKEIKMYDLVVNPFDRVLNVEGDNVVNIFEILSQKDRHNIYRLLTISDFRVMRQFINSIEYKDANEFITDDCQLMFRIGSVSVYINDKSSEDQIVIYENKNTLNTDLIELRCCSSALDVASFMKIILDVYKANKNKLELVSIKKQSFMLYL